MKFYIASSYERREEMKVNAERLKSIGHEVTSRWLYEDEENIPLTPETRCAYGSHDFEDINSADALIVFPAASNSGGHQAEFGIALGLGKKLFCVEGRTNNFHYLPNVTYLPTFSDFLTNIYTRFG